MTSREIPAEYASRAPVRQINRRLHRIDSLSRCEPTEVITFLDDLQEQPPQESLAEQGVDIIGTGTRRNDLTAANSPTPIDIISSDELLNQGSSDANDIPRQQVPSLNVQRFTSNDGSVFTRPYSMRGLPPDQTLVLVNGKRRHRGATVQLSNIPYIRGSQGLQSG